MQRKAGLNSHEGPDLRHYDETLVQQKDSVYIKSSLPAVRLRRYMSGGSHENRRRDHPLDDLPPVLASGVSGFTRIKGKEKPLLPAGIKKANPQGCRRVVRETAGQSSTTPLW